MTSKKELSVVVSNGYHPLNSRWCPKSPGLALDKILFWLMNRYLKDKTEQKYYSKKWLIESLSWQKKVNCQVDYFCVFFCVKSCIAKQQNLCEKSVLSNSVWSVLTKLFRSVRRSLLCKKQWRKKWIAYSTSLPQLHIGLSVSWKLCLNVLTDG